MRLRLYAVLPRRISAEVLPKGLEREPLRLIRFGAFSFAAGDATRELLPSRTNLLAHDRLIRRIARVSPAILPARFGMVVDDAVRLKVLALDRAAELREALTLVTGREQMTLRMALPKRPARHGRPSSGSGYLHARAAAVRGPDLPEIRAVRRHLSSLVRSEHASQGQPDVLTLYHLIDRGHAAAYRALVRTLETPVPLQVSGPFAPYAFAPATLG